MRVGLWLLMGVFVVVLVVGGVCVFWCLVCDVGVCGGDSEDFKLVVGLVVGDVWCLVIGVGELLSVVV